LSRPALKAVLMALGLTGLVAGWRPSVTASGHRGAIPRQPTKMRWVPRVRQRFHRIDGPPAGFALTLTRLARIAMAEAGNQPEAAQIGVDDVVLHRLHTPGFPSTLWGVLHQPGQFQSVANGLYQRVVPTPTAWQAARAAWTGVDVVPGALYFDTPAFDRGNPWTRQLTGCRWIGAMRFCQSATPVSGR